MHLPAVNSTFTHLNYWGPSSILSMVANFARGVNFLHFILSFRSEAVLSG